MWAKSTRPRPSVLPGAVFHWGNNHLNQRFYHMNYATPHKKYREYQEMQKRRREGLRRNTGSTVLLSSALCALLFAFVFYDRPITNNNQIFSYLRGEQTTGMR